MIDLAGLFTRRRDRKRLDRFFTRYAHRALIIHGGLTLDWLDELLKVGGGGGYFRIDARPSADPQSPVSWLTHRFILPLKLPLPLICDVKEHHIAIRHLHTRRGICHPADIAWILDDIRHKSRAHAILHRETGALLCEKGMPPEDNDYEMDFTG